MSNIKYWKFPWKQNKKNPNFYEKSKVIYIKYIKMSWGKTSDTLNCETCQCNKLPNQNKKKSLTLEYIRNDFIEPVRILLSYFLSSTLEKT